MKRENTNTFKIICCAVATLFAFGMTLSLLGLLLPSNNSDNAPSTRFEQSNPTIVRLSQLPIGTKIKVHHDEMGDIPFLIVDRNHDGYPENSTTLITQKIICMYSFDAAEPDNTDSNRQAYGSNKYSVSNIDQWLNSSAAAGQWYSARHSTDHAPFYETDAGFLAGFDDDFISVLQDTELSVDLHNIDGGGYDSFVRKFFLPSAGELCFSLGSSYVNDGSSLSYFVSHQKSAVISDYAATHSKNSSYRPGFNGTYWLRSVRISSMSHSAFALNNVGSKDSYAVSGRNGVRPVCNISSDTFVTMGNDGCYELFFF